MIGLLPRSLNVNGIDYPIETDFRRVLIVLSAFNDKELSMNEKGYIMADAIYGESLKDIPKSDLKEALDKARWFIDGGKTYTEQKSNKRVIDWDKDESMIFSAVNKVAQKETRECEYIHWWTWLGYFNEIGEGLLSTVISIRQKKNENKKLEKYEKDFYSKHRDLIDIDVYSAEDRKEIDEVIKQLK